MRRLRRFTPSRCIFAGLVLALLAFVAYHAYLLGGYFTLLDKFSGHIARGDRSAAREEHERLKEFHQNNPSLTKFYLWLAPKYGFPDPALLQASFFYIEGAYGQAIKELEGSDSFWAAYLRGNANWRQAQQIYANGLTLDDPKLKQDQLDEANKKIEESVKEDYALAVKKDPHQTVAPKWNYDLITNPASRQRGLAPKPMKVKVQLGEAPSKGKDNPGPEGENGDGKGKKDLDTNKGKGPGNPEGRPKKVG